MSDIERSATRARAKHGRSNGQRSPAQLRHQGQSLLHLLLSALKPRLVLLQPRKLRAEHLRRGRPNLVVVHEALAILPPRLPARSVDELRLQVAPLLADIAIGGRHHTAPGVSLLVLDRGRRAEPPVRRLPVLLAEARGSLQLLLVISLRRRGVRVKNEACEEPKRSRESRH